MKYARFLYLFLSLSLPLNFLYTQNHSDFLKNNSGKVKIDSILFTGLDITEQDIIRKELDFEVGDSVNSAQLKFNQERVFSLGIFTKVNFQLQKRQEKNIVVIEVKESWYIYPIPFIDAKDKDIHKLSYGLFLVVKNFRGRNESLRLRAAFGYDPNFQLSYYNPYLNKDENIFFNAAVSYSKITNKSKSAKALFGGDFDQKIFSSEIILGKRFDLFYRLSANIGYRRIENPVFIKGISASDDKIDNLFSLGLSFIYDTRDLSQFPKKGSYISFHYIFSGLGINGINYKVFKYDLRKYIPIAGDLGLKGRLSSRFTFGNTIPFYDYSFLGFSERIRGHFKNEREGNHYYLASLETFYPLVKDFNFGLNFIPFLPKSLFRYRFAMYLSLFIDSGTTQFRDSSLALNTFDTGYGIGLTILFLPYNTLRFDYAFDEKGRSELIFTTGISF